jgi:hypothetical protein
MTLERSVSARTDFHDLVWYHVTKYCSLHGWIFILNQTLDHFVHHPVGGEVPNGVISEI